MERIDGSENGPDLQTVVRAGNMLFAFTSEQPELGLTQLTAALGLSKASVHRLAQTLVSLGLLEQNAETRSYRLGVRILQLAHVVEASLDLRTEARAALRDLRDQTGETVYLMLRRGDQAVCTERIEGTHPLRDLSTPPGTFVPLSVGAAGTAILSTLDNATARSLVGRAGMNDALRDRIDAARTAGHAFSRGDVTDGVGAIAVPLRDERGTVVGAISLGGLLTRVEASEQDLANAVHRAVAAVSTAMGWTHE
ncbi:IclR family transcriptional regulator [Homoserinibacter sp. GY 40078]|uniref:IclR family transcriptional regulator n=1 Tax=Homoserinibacter sp. GY 40078 TaxID=2603275 RepID=UPI00164FFF65|nr:IclR family transcriptional regulator [Homoserinibacter sp. GY 40078]